MSDQKTKPTQKPVAAFLSQISDPGRRNDCQALIKLMSKVTGEKAVNPAQFAAAALRMARAAILDGGVTTRQRPRHQELCVLG